MNRLQAYKIYKINEFEAELEVYKAMYENNELTEDELIVRAYCLAKDLQKQLERKTAPKAEKLDYITFEDFEAILNR